MLVLLLSSCSAPTADKRLPDTDGETDTTHTGSDSADTATSDTGPMDTGPTDTGVADPCSGVAVTVEERPEPNLTLNGGFEDDSDGDGFPDSWATWAGWGEMVIDDTTAAEGAQSLRLRPTDYGAMPYQPLPLEPGAWYEVSMKLRVGPGISGAWVSIYDRNTTSYLAPFFGMGRTDDEWVEYGPFRFQAPPSAADAWIAWYAPYDPYSGVAKEDASAWMDDVQVRRVADVDDGPSIDWLPVFRFLEAYYRDYYPLYPDARNKAWGYGYAKSPLLEVYGATGDTAWLDRYLDYARDDIATLSDTPAASPYDSLYADGFKGWGQDTYEQYAPMYTEWMCDDGLIAAPDARFSRIVAADPSLELAYGAEAEEIRSVLEANVAEKWRQNWDPDPGWTEEDDSRWLDNAGWSLYDWSGWAHQPLNMYLSYTELLLHLQQTAALRGTSTSPELVAHYDEQVPAMLQFFRDELTDAGGAWQWEYGRNSAFPGIPEDTGHAFVDIYVAMLAADAGIVFTDADMLGFAGTFTDHVWNGDVEHPEFAYYMDGTGGFAQSERAWAFTWLGRYDLDVWRLMDTWAGQNVSTMQPHHAGALAAVARRWDTVAPGAVGAPGSDDSGVLTWERPLRDEDGSGLSGLAGYRFEVSPDDGETWCPVDAEPIRARAATLVGVEEGWRVAIRAVDYALNASPRAEIP